MKAMVILSYLGGLQSQNLQRVFTWVSLIVFLVISYIELFTAIIAFM